MKTIIPQTAGGVSNTITATYSNLSFANLKEKHFPRDGVLEVYEISFE